MAAPAQAYDDWNPDLAGFPSNTHPSARANCLGGSGACVDRTIGEMWRRFHTVVPTCDDNNVFSLTYLRVTQDIRRAVDSGFYSDLHWINQQDAMFARIYFLTYDNYLAGRRDLVPDSWLTAFDAGRDATVQGIGNLLLSINAHVNRDFPFILYHAGLTNPDGSSKKPDHDAYNERLRALYKPMLTELAHRFDETIDDYDIPGVVIDDDSFFQLLIQWRESAWQFAKRLTDAGGAAERRSIAAEIEANANAWATLIYGGTYLLPQDRAARDARCARFGGQRSRYRRAADVAEPGRRAVLDGNRLRVKVSCPDGVGPCAGELKVRLPRRYGDGFLMIARRHFHVDADRRRRYSVRLGGKERRELAVRNGRRGVWLGARSKQGPHDAVTKRRKARLRVR